MQLLQDTAKHISDDKLVIVAFASSDSLIPNLMRARSSASRLIGRVVIGDITDEQALDYLTCLCNDASSDELATVVKLVGGRFIDCYLLLRSSRNVEWWEQNTGTAIIVGTSTEL